MVGRLCIYSKLSSTVEPANFAPQLLLTEGPPFSPALLHCPCPSIVQASCHSFSAMASKQPPMPGLRTAEDANPPRLPKPTAEETKPDIRTALFGCPHRGLLPSGRKRRNLIVNLDGTSNQFSVNVRFPRSIESLSVLTLIMI